MEPTPTREQHARVDDPGPIQMEPSALERRGAGGDDRQAQVDAEARSEAQRGGPGLLSRIKAKAKSALRS